MRRVVMLAFALAPACEVGDRCVTGEACTPLQLVPMAIDGSELVTGDLDGDGRRDVVAVDAFGFGVSVRWGAAEGLTPATRWGTPAATRSVRLGDVDGDGRVDVVALTTDGAAAWLRNAGGRALAPAQAFALPVAARAAVAGDVDGDGDDDLVLGEQDAARLHVLPGGPQGPGAAWSVAIGGEAVALAAGDVDGDGADEVVAAAAASGRVEVLRGGPDGPLSAVTVAREGGFPVAALLADLDGDGRLDLAIGDALDPSVWIGLGDGRGAWPKVQVWSASSEPARLVPLRGADGGELAVIAADERDVAVLDPRTAALKTATRAQRPMVGVAALDLDGDGRDELIAGGEIPAAVRRIDGLQPVTRWQWPLVGEAGHVARADLDGDGARELVVEDVERAALVVYAPEGSGFAERERVALTHRLGGLVPLALGDGREAVARWGMVGTASGQVLEVLSQEPGKGLAVTASATLAAVAVGAVAADVDGDGADELAVWTADVQYGLPRPAGLLVARPGADGALAVEAIAGVDSPTGVSAADEDGDGRATLSVLDQVQRLHEVRATADGWEVEALWLPSWRTGSVAWADADGDGTAELLLCGEYGVAVARDVDGLLAAERLFEGTCSTVHACDVDGDGAGELVIAREGGLSGFVWDPSVAVEVLRRGPAGWSSAGGFAPMPGATAVDVGCEDGLVVAASGRLGAALVGVAPGPALAETPGRGAMVSPPAIADLDGDGVDELVAGTDAAVLVAARDGTGRFGPVKSLALPVARPLRYVVAAALDDAPGDELLVGRGEPGDFESAVWGLRDGRLVELATGTDASGDLADFEGDGREEVLREREGQLQVAWPLPRAGEPAVVSVTLAGDGAALVAKLHTWTIADADGDGRADIVLGESSPPAEPDAPYTDTLWVLRNAGGGRFEAPREWEIAGHWGGARFGDVDGDGASELLVFTEADVLVVCDSDGRGGPGGACREWWTPPEDSYVAAPAVGDVDGDGVNDVLVVVSAGYGDATLQTLRGQGGGRAFALEPLDMPEGAGSYAIVGAAAGPGRPAWVLAGDGGAVVIGGGP